MSEMHEIDFNKVPEWWAVCSRTDCPVAQVCLRQRVYSCMPKSVKTWRCLMPEAMMPIEGDGRCRYFAKSEWVRFAYGFDSMMTKVHSRDGRFGIRMDLTHYFGSKGSYYRSKHGERQLSPADQQKVLSVFAQYGCVGDDFKFDSYEEGYAFEPLE